MSWLSVLEKSSTKNPDLNLFNPSVSVICIFKVSLSNKEVTAPLYKNNTDKNGFFAVAKIETGEKVTPSNIVEIDGVKFKKIRVKYGTKKESIPAGVLYEGTVYRSTADIPAYGTNYRQDRASLIAQLDAHLLDLKNSSDLEITGTTVEKQRTSVDYKAIRLVSNIVQKLKEKGGKQKLIDKGEPGTNFKDLETQMLLIDNEVASMKTELKKMGKWSWNTIRSIW